MLMAIVMEEMIWLGSARWRSRGPPSYTTDAGNVDSKRTSTTAVCVNVETESEGYFAMCSQVLARFVGHASGEMGKGEGKGKWQ